MLVLCMDDVCVGQILRYPEIDDKMECFTGKREI